MAIKKALENKKTKNTKKQRSLYGDGNSSKKIVKLLEKIDLNKIPIQKKLTYQMTNIIVLGGSGFIGKSLIQRLVLNKDLL